MFLFSALRIFFRKEKCSFQSRESDIFIHSNYSLIVFKFNVLQGFLIYHHILIFIHMRKKKFARG